MLPLCAEVNDPAAWPEENRIDGNVEGGIAFSTRFGRFLFLIKTVQPVQAQLFYARLQVAMMLASGKMEEPMQNLLCWTDDGNYHLAVFPRQRHRPANYGTGPGRWLLSPASTEMAGLWAVAEADDYNALTAERVQALYNELCVDNAMAVRMIDNYFKTKMGSFN